MRIFLCGAQGVGKSTLATSLSADYGLEIKDSYSKGFLEKNPEIQNSASIGYNEFQDKILLYCLSQYVNDKDFISSRSIIDSFAYLAACNSDNKIILTNFINHFSEYVTTKDCIYIYIPIEFGITDGNNSLRNTDSQFQKTVDEEMQRYFNKLKKGPSEAAFHILSGTREERLQGLKQIIINKWGEDV